MRKQYTFQAFYANMDWEMLAEQRKLLAEVEQNKELTLKDRNVIGRIIALIDIWRIYKDRPDFPVLNWVRLRDDKVKYLYIQNEQSLTLEQWDAMEGILNGIDAFQDAAVDEMGLKETDVFTLTEK